MLLPNGHLDGILKALADAMVAEERALISPDESESKIVEFVHTLAAIWKFTPDAVHLLESAAYWRDSLITLLCSHWHLEPELVEDMLGMWAHSACVAVQSSCQSALMVVKRKLMMNPDDEILTPVTQVFDRVISLLDSDKEAQNMLIQQFLPDWEKLIDESLALHLMASEIVNGRYCSAGLPTSTVFRPFGIERWLLLPKIAFVTSHITVNYVIANHDLAETISYLFVSLEVCDILFGLNARQIKVSYHL